MKKEISYSVQSFIMNIAFPKTLEELLIFINEHGQFNIEDILFDDQPGEWTAPNWAKIGDIVFFMHSKTARTTITGLRTQLIKKKNEYSSDVYNEMMSWLENGLELHKEYGGKIFAVARVVGVPEYYRDEDLSSYHWKSKIYADMSDKWLLKNPVDISEFNSFIYVARQSSITPVYGEEYDKLKELILMKNTAAPYYFISSKATPIPLRKINEGNWLKLSSEYRRSFMLEQQFRSFYVNYFLKILGDKKTIYRECRCQKTGMADSYVDNLILFNGRYLPVEVKLNIHNEADLRGQVRKYCHTEKMYLDNGADKAVPANNIYSYNVLIIDTEAIYLYDYSTNDYREIINLDCITTPADIILLRDVLIENMNTEYSNE